MVELMTVLSQVVVPLVVSLLACILVLGRVYVRTLKPLVEQVQTIQYEASKAIKTGMSAMGDKGKQVQQDGALEKMVAKDILDQFPEIEIILGLVSPQTAEAIREHPERAMRLLDRYKDIIPLLTGGAAAKQQITYEF